MTAKNEADPTPSGNGQCPDFQRREGREGDLPCTELEESFLISVDIVDWPLGWPKLCLKKEKEKIVPHPTLSPYLPKGGRVEPQMR